MELFLAQAFYRMCQANALIKYTADLFKSRTYSYQVGRSLQKQCLRPLCHRDNLLALAKMLY